MADTIGHYLIKEKLGSGGMGEVYLAEDTRLHRRVALKVLPPEVASDAQRRNRFLQEAHAASMLSHPNVSTIYEVGEDSETIFIAMELIEGRTLAQIRQAREMTIDEIIDIAIQAADALDEAQARGIVHRDIKSANLMLTPRGHVKVLDFGLAKVAAAAQQGAESDATKIKTTPGLVMGTCYYMSPEQALGRPVDHRSDLFSLGVVLYELSTGKLPFVGSTVSETVEKITHAQPDPIARFNYALPGELERIIRKLLEKDPDRRYQTARELLVDLKNLKRDTSSGEVAARSAPPSSGRFSPAQLWSAAGIFIAMVAMLVVFRPWSTDAKPASPQAIESVAVLPFVNTTKNPETEYLSDGISETIINNLSQLSSLRVIPRSTVFRYKGQDDISKIADELNVRAIVSGRVMQRGDTLNVQAELVDVESESQLWGGRYEGKVSDALRLQEEISREVSNRLRPARAAQQAASRPGMTANAEAYQLYLKGRYHWNKRTGESLRKALRYFQQAVEADPRFALAHVGIADSYVLMTQYADMPAAEATSRGEAAVRKALSLEEAIAEAHATLGIVYHNRWEFTKSEQEYKRAISLNPNYPTAYHWYNLLLESVGRNEEALSAIRRAQQLDPLALIIGANLVRVLTNLDRDEEAMQVAEKYLEIDPAFPQILSVLSRLHTRAGRHEQAIAAARRARELSGDVTEQVGVLATAHAAAGQRQEALRLIRLVEQRVERGEADPYYVAAAYVALGDHDRAFAAIDESIDLRSNAVLFMAADDRLTPLRSDPRFQKALRRIGIRS